MSFGHYPRRDTTDLVALLARRPELRDVGIAGYLAGAAIDGAPGMPPMRGVIRQEEQGHVTWIWWAAA